MSLSAFLSVSAKRPTFQFVNATIPPSHYFCKPEDLRTRCDMGVYWRIRRHVFPLSGTLSLGRSAVVGSLSIGCSRWLTLDPPVNQSAILMKSLVRIILTKYLLRYLVYRQERYVAHEYSPAISGDNCAVLELQAKCPQDTSIIVSTVNTPDYYIRTRV